MAYRRRQGITKTSTLKEEFLPPSKNDFILNPAPPLFPSSSSLAAQAIKASSASRRESSAFASDHVRSKGVDTYEDASDSGRGGSRSGFWGVLAQKAKAILEEDKLASHNGMQEHDRMRSQSFNTSNGGQLKQSYQSPETLRKMDNPSLRKGLDAITSSLNHLGDTFEKAFEEGRTIVESKTADLRTQIRRKGSSPDDRNQPPLTQNPDYHETQLKASRDVAMATAAKAKLLLRELKTVKADLAFAKARCAQLEEENKLLRDREGHEKGHDGADDDMIRDQLETLLAEKARLANENEIYSRENRFLREVVEYHQLTMQDVVYVDEGMEEVTEVYPMDANGVPRMLSVSSLSSSPPSPKATSSMTKEILPLPQENMSTSRTVSGVPPSVPAAEDDPAK